MEAALDAGQSFIRVHVFPFRMTEEAMRRYTPAKWQDESDFWCGLADDEEHEFFTHPEPNWPVNPEWFDVPSFWCDLRRGYDFFEEEGYPPAVSVVARRYHFR